MELGIIKVPLGQRLNLPRPEDDANLLHLIKLKGERESLGNSPVVLSRQRDSRPYLSVFVIPLYTYLSKIRVESCVLGCQQVALGMIIGYCDGSSSFAVGNPNP